MFCEKKNSQSCWENVSGQTAQIKQQGTTMADHPLKGFSASTG